MASHEGGAAAPHEDATAVGAPSHTHAYDGDAMPASFTDTVKVGHLAGFVIGRKGTTIRAIGQETGTYCAVDDSVPGHEVANISGPTQEAVDAAREKILEVMRMGEEKGPRTDFAYREYVMVNRFQAARIIGRRGNRVNSIESSTGAFVRILSRHGEQRVMVEAHSEAAGESAMEQVKAAISEADAAAAYEGEPPWFPRPGPRGPQAPRAYSDVRGGPSAFGPPRGRYPSESRQYDPAFAGEPSRDEWYPGDRPPPGSYRSERGGRGGPGPRSRGYAGPAPESADYASGYGGPMPYYGGSAGYHSASGPAMQGYPPMMPGAARGPRGPMDDGRGGVPMHIPGAAASGVAMPYQYPAPQAYMGYPYMHVGDAPFGHASPQFDPRIAASYAYSYPGALPASHQVGSPMMMDSATSPSGTAAHPMHAAHAMHATASAPPPSGSPTALSSASQ